MTKPITRKEFVALQKMALSALRLAAHHDPDHEHRLQLVEHRLDRIGAPQYRTIRKGNQKFPRTK
jgi:hypothetical protein